MFYEVQNQVLNGITLNQDDYMCVYHGGIVKNTTINEDGEMEVLEGVASNTVINDGGTMLVTDEGTAYGITVKAGGELEVEGGTVYNLVWTPCVGKVEIESGSVVTFASSLTGVYYGVNNVLQKNAQTMTGVNVTGDMCVMSGGSAYNSYVSGEGEIWVYSGGSVNNITVQGGGLFVMSGGTATNVNWTPCVGYMEYDDGATVTFTSKYSGVYYGSNGRLLSNTITMSNKEVEDCDCYVMSGGIANNFEVYEDGWLVVSGGTINNTLAEDGGEITVELGVASNTTLQYGGEMDLEGSGCSAVKTNVGSYSELNVRDGAIATNTTIGQSGSMDVEYGGKAINTTVNRNATLYLSAGAVHSGTLNMNGGYVYADSDSKIDFTLVGRTAADDFMISSMENIIGAPEYSITVSANQALGTYKLAQGASNFTGTITICTEDTCFGALTVNGAVLTYSSKTYSLVQSSGNLQLVISDGSSAGGSQVKIYSSGSLVKQGTEFTGEIIVAGGNNSMFVASGGTANSTTINTRGSLFVLSKGIANNTTVNYYGEMHISSGGVANNTIMNNFSLLHVSSGGVANSTTFGNGGVIDIFGGGIANNTSISNYGLMYIESEGTANNTTVNSAGYMYISSGATANSTTVNSNGYMRISSGGTANNTTVNYGGSMFINTGATANNTTINYGGDMYISSGATANSTTVNSAGYMHIYTGATANNTTVNSRGSMYIYSGGTALQIKENGGYVDLRNGANVTFASNTINGITLSKTSMTVHENTVANNTTVNSSGCMYIYSGGIANNTTVIEDWSYLNIFSGGIADSTTISSGGNLHISSGGTVNNTIVNSLGFMRIYSGGKHCGALQMKSGASVSAYSGAIIDFTVADRTSADDYLINNLALIQGTPTYTITVSADQKAGTYKLAQGASNFTGTITICTQDTCFGKLTVNGAVLTYSSKTYSLVQSSGKLQLVISNVSSAQVKIYSSGSLVKQGTEFTGEIIVSGGNNSMFVSSGGTANNTTVNSKGYMYIYDGATANSTTVNSGGSMFIYDGATANSTTVNSRGYMYINSGATANSTTVNSNGYMYINDGATANSTIVTEGYMFIYSGATANSTTVNSGGYMHISSGGTANSTTINDNGHMYINDGATANNTTVDWGDMTISSGGTANNTTVNSYGTMNISSGGTANSTIVKSSGSVNILSGGIANNTTVIEDWSYLNISSGGIANDTTISSGGNLHIDYGATANNTIVYSLGIMRIYSGGKHCGALQMESGATVSAYSGAIIDFTVADRTSADDYLINNLALVKGAPTYTITVSADQAYGTYKLAQGASALNGSITICTQDTCFGTLTINGDALTYNDTTYQLTNTAGSLTLTVSDNVEPEPVFAFGKFNGVGGMFELTVDGVGYVHNAYTKLQLSGTLDSTKWELVGVADFNGCKTDGLLWQEKATGYVYMQNNMISFDEVNNKQYCLGVVGEGYEILAAGDFTGTGINGVVMQGPAFGDSSVSLNYGLPIWGREADGSTFNGWLGALVNTWQPGDALKGNVNNLADINARNYMYEVVSVGDYNGDGVDDVMLQNVMPTTVDGVTITGSGDVFTFLTGDMNAVKAGAAPTVAYAGCATGGWEIMGSGDFNGDGIDDVLLSDGTGVAGWQMANGQQTGNQWFGNLGANEEIAGIADLNNDGTDDIVILNAATDTYHGWMISNGTATYAVTLA